MTIDRPIRPRALVWDMDGTLIDSATVVPDAFIATVDALAGQGYDRADVVALYSLGAPPAMLTRMLARPATLEDVDAYHRELAGRADAVRAYPGIIETLTVLRPRLPMAVFTGASTQAAEILLRAAGLDGFFDVVVGGDQISRPKPDPEGIVRACGLLGVAPAATAYVGDAPTDLLAAERSGARPLAAAWGHLHSVAAAADRAVERPTDLIGLLTNAP